MHGARAKVIAYLRSLEGEGARFVPLDEAARKVLRAWMLAARARRTAEPRDGAMRPVVKAPTSGEATETVSVAGARHSEQPPAEGFLTRALADAESPAAETEDEEEAVPFFRPGGATPEEIWGNFARMLPRWEPLRALGTLRATAVLGEGNKSAAVMLVGDAPNYYDEKSRRPFSGAAGEKLDGMLAAMGLSREAVYVTLAVPFRPALPRQTTNNRPPDAAEIKFSRPVLEAQINLVKPRVIVALGVIASRSLLGGEELPLDAFRRKEHRFAGVPVVATHHPSYLLRTSDLAERRLVWEDMIRAMELAGLPVTEKQRRYFLPR